MEIVDNEIRDDIMNEITSKRGNQTCFDCGSPLPRWSSPYLGILLCIDCAGRHRGYGTHISFVKSIDLDKWNKKQLKSLELTGNSYTKKKFEELGVPKIDSIYDYNSNLILDFRKEIDNLVKENLKPDDYLYKRNKDKISEENKKSYKNIYTNNNVTNEEDEKLLKPLKFVKKIEKINNNKESNKKTNKKNKIKKIDFDFNFDDYKEETNHKLNKDDKNEEEVNTKNITGMKLSRKDKKRMLIEERNKKKNIDNGLKKTCCEKIKEFIINIFSFFKARIS